VTEKLSSFEPRSGYRPCVVHSRAIKNLPRLPEAEPTQESLTQQIRPTIAQREATAELAEAGKS
jgi:hypothetical protein